MNRGNVLQSSSVQGMMAAGSPNNWWSMMNTRPPPPQNQQSPFFPATATVSPPPHFFPHQYEPPSLHSWHDHNQDFQDSSLTQLLMSGLVGDQEDHKSALTQMQKVKKLENWEEQLLHDHHHQQQPSANGDSMVESLVKQEASPDSYGYGDDRRLKPVNWSGQMIKSSCPNSSVTSMNRNMVDFSTCTSNKADGRHPPPDRSSESNGSTGSGGTTKKARVQPSSTQSTFKVRKEKLGDRITALHQMVSPFGKTDTASVLLEAMGYIRFLQAQIQALSLPYLSSGSTNTYHQHSDYDVEPKKNLRSRGLCLVPVSCTIQVGSNNGADYWAPANNFRL